VIAWTLFSGESRAAFVAGLPVDAAAWARGRGWALWKALITYAGLMRTHAEDVEASRRVIEAVLADHRRAQGRSEA
jgi:aminoglycoside phosphotransferase (APT) family kinase protein